MRGRKPELVAIEGGLARAPGAPSWLPPEARAEWRRIMPEMVRRRTIARSDLATVESYCLAVGTVQRAQKTISAEGDLITTEKGEQRRHPAFQSLFQALTESRRLAAELGLTPASRGKAQAIDESERDAWSDMDI